MGKRKSRLAGNVGTFSINGYFRLLPTMAFGYWLSHTVAYEKSDGFTFATQNATQEDTASLSERRLSVLN